MPSTTASAKPSTSAKKTKVDSDSILLTALADPSKCDEQLARRLANALRITEPFATVKPAVKGKQKATPHRDDTEEKRRLAMRAANAMSQSLATLIQSGWKALNQKATPGFSTETALSIISSFRTSIAFLRDVGHDTIEVERVASGFVGKLITVQFYEHALDLLEDIRFNVIRHYHHLSPPPPLKKTTARSISKPFFTKYVHLVQYPHPAPQDPILLALIGTSLGQALTAVTAVISIPQAKDSVFETFIAMIEGNDGPLSWHSFLPADNADSLLARAHRVLATTFASSNTPPHLLLRLRALALRCLLCKTILEPDLFWKQATDYMVSHGKSVTKPDETGKAVNEVSAFFNSIVIVARGRHDAESFLSGPAFHKFCDVALIFAKRGDMASLSIITRFINENHAKNSPGPQNVDLDDLNIIATFSQGTATLEKCHDDCTNVIDAVSQCTETLEASRQRLDLGFKSKTAQSMENLRRACCQILGDATKGQGLRKATKVLLVTILETMERHTKRQRSRPTMIDFTSNIVDSLCTLAKVELSTANSVTHMTSYDYLQRGVSLVNTSLDSSTEPIGETPSLSLIKLLRVLAGNFWNSAVTLYQDSKYAAAIRFLVPACALSVKVCNLIGPMALDDSDGVPDLRTQWKILKSSLPKRWETLGDCYAKIGERRPAHSAFLEALKSYSVDSLCLSAASSSPSQLSSEEPHRRLASLVERTTYIAVFDLLVSDEVSLRKSLCAAKVDYVAVGIILEWQASSLEEHSWKKEVQPVLARLLQDTLDLYGKDFPIRRTRTLLRQLDLAYRIDDLSVPVDEIAAEIQDLLSIDCGQDTAFVGLQAQYKAAAHIWSALHAHRRSSDSSSSRAILHHATLASGLLRGVFPSAPISTVVKSSKLSPKVVMAKSTRSTSRMSPRKKKMIGDANPVTPKPRKALRTPPKLKESSAFTTTPTKFHALTADNSLVTNIQMIARLMGLLGHVILKLQFLNIVQRMAERSAGPSADDFIRASVDAANEYLRLGKTQRAMAIFVHTLAAANCPTSQTVSEEVRVLLLLHYAAFQALSGNTEKSSTLYEEARILSQNIECQQFNSTAARLRGRILTLERSALASSVFSSMQVAQDDPHAAFSALRQSLRLWNRAFETSTRLSPSIPAPFQNANPFDMTSLHDALPTTSDPFRQEPAAQKKAYKWRIAIGDLQWRIAEGLLHTLFGLGRAYFLQGTVRGAEYYIEQARDLSQTLHSPTLLSRALARKGEIQLHQGKLEDAATTLLEASELLQDVPGIDAAEINRLRAKHNQLNNKHEEAKALYVDAVNVLFELEKTLGPIENSTSSPKRSSLGQSPGRSHHTDVLVPSFLANVLRQQIWLQRDEPQDEIKALLRQISMLPPSRETKAEELAILAKLALHDAHVKFRADLFLSSLAESTIALPMGALNHGIKLSPSARQMLETLSTVEKMFWDSLGFISRRGQASEVRESALSLVLIRSFQISLGKSGTTGAQVVAGLLDASAAVTLRRELIDEIDHKFPDLTSDDLVWRTVHDRRPIQATQSPRSTNADDDPDFKTPGLDLQAYWRAVRDRYYASHDVDDQTVCTSQADDLPPQWTVVNISITEDKSTMFFSRQRRDSAPLVFCVPLERHGRKEDDAASQFTYWDAVGQLREILGESDVSAEKAKKVSSQDRDAKVAWWAERAELDKRLKDLLDNIEFCWLGAFKTILSEPVDVQLDVLDDLRNRFDNVFKRNLASDKKRMSHVKLDDSLLECFASLSPKCRDEELEDLVYFVLDLYQFHGIHVALSEIDIDQLTVELRTELEEHALKAKGRIVPMKDPHLFLVLDKNVQGLPWESIPILRGRSVSRIPSFSFLMDRIELAKLQRESTVTPITSIDRAMVDPRKTFYVLNPSGDLSKSEERFASWVKEMGRPDVGWQGVIGQVPSEQELLNAFSQKDLMVYFGHGGAEQYVRSFKIRQLQRCAATMLWGCSSGLMRDMGDFDRIGTPYNYMLAGCPTLVACLWDVTDNELDKISRSVFDKLRLDAEHVRAWRPELVDDAPMSVVAAVGQSRDACKLKYLTGAAPVVYGIPFYL